MADPIMMSGGPPLPPMGAGSTSPASPTPTMASLSGRSMPPTSAGAGQIGGAAVRMALEIDQALKLLAQTIPQLGPWVEKTTMELRNQIGQALQGGVGTSPMPQGNDQFPGGMGNL